MLSERTLRNWGIALLVFGFVASTYLSARWLDWWGTQTDWRLSAIPMSLLVNVVTPLGATFIAVSLIVRALMTGVSARFERGLLASAVGLIVLGLLSQSYGTDATNSVTEYLGPTGEAGAILVSHAINIITAAATPLGVALVAVVPVLRWVRGMPAIRPTADQPGEEHPKPSA